MDTTAACYIGSAVAKAQLDIAVRPRGEQWTATHDEAGRTALGARVQCRPGGRRASCWKPRAGAHCR